MLNEATIKANVIVKLKLNVAAKDHKSKSLSHTFVKLLGQCDLCWDIIASLLLYIYIINIFFPKISYNISWLVPTSNTLLTKVAKLYNKRNKQRILEKLL
jgi:hypothetical protein